MSNVFYLHPVFQAIATVLGLCALWQGWQRAKSRHFGSRSNFSWTGHARVGRLAIVLWLIGGVVAIVFIGLGGMLLRPVPHVFVGWTFIPVALFVYASGWKLEQSGGRRKGLAVTHGLAGLALVLAALFQGVSGALMVFG